MYCTCSKTKKIIKIQRALKGDCNGNMNDGNIYYYYGMRLRGFSIGCQPKEGFVERMDDPKGEYWDILKYSRKLSDFEKEAYSLDFLHRAGIGL